MRTLAMVLLLAACAPAGHCTRGSCTCEPTASCHFGCAIGSVCSVDCTGQNASCEGTCSSGECVCGEGSTCTFHCGTGPCHARCASGSTCHMLCASSPCTTDCEAGAHCTQQCGVTDVGTSACNIASCAAGDHRLCPDGTSIACGASCP